MYFDFTLILTLLTLASGAVLLIDRLFFYSKRRNKTMQLEFSELVKLAERKIDKTNLKLIRRKSEPKLVDTARSFFPVLFIVLIIRSFLFEPYQIPSGSMLPTLQIGDFILVNKFTYGIRLPVLGTKITNGSKAHRGDVMVFRAPFDTKNNYIKRVIGLPGDTITITDGTLNINGEEVPHGMLQAAKNGQMSVFSETLDDKSYTINLADQPMLGERTWQVPEKFYFVMGDNRPNSYDSRFWGFVPDELIVGKAVSIWMTWKQWFSLPSFDRIGAIDKTTP